MGPSCPFCEPDQDRVFYRGTSVYGLWDAFPVSDGHALVIPKRHIATWFEASRDEQAELLTALDAARAAVHASYEPAGFNIGVNVGEAAGQTVPHLHVHLIPRYEGDVRDPRGGIRHVIPERAAYPFPSGTAPGRAADSRPHPLARDPAPLVRGGDDPLLPHLLDHLDRAERADLLASFVLDRGVGLLKDHILDLLDRGGRIRILAGDYLGITEPQALLRLLDIEQSAPERMAVRVFASEGRSFHPKAYIFHGDFEPFGSGVAYVGSSNLSRSALVDGIEWNYRILAAGPGFRAITEEFDRLFEHRRSAPLTAAWIARYRERRSQAPPVPAEGTAPESPPAVPQPHEVQTEALEALERTRGEGDTAGLVVLATGLGKTWLAAFDTVRFGAKRVLFVAHREEILRQARDTFRKIRPDAVLGLYTGAGKEPAADVLFASVQTLGKAAHLRNFRPEAFDYIIVDEFHHACAGTYRRLIAYFDAAFLLGLTATPERTDGGDLLALCGENLVYRCDLLEGIERGLLTPFRYLGVPDTVDYENIPWRSSRFDEGALETAVATNARADNALAQYRQHGGERTLAFCCSRRHADFMAAYFRRQGVRARSVHTGPTGAPRARALEELRDGELDVIFAVDIFNEGVDLPALDTILMLRPTESRTLWLQQFGRGLRISPGKDRLRVIDYIGNHRTFLVKPRALLGLGEGDREVALALDRILEGELGLPPGCEVTYELEAIETLRSLLRTPKGAKKLEALRAWYEDFRERHGTRPAALEVHHAGHRPRDVRKSHGSWLGFVREMEDFTENQERVWKNETARAFLTNLDRTAMTKSYKMLTLLAMLDADALPGELPVDALARGFARLAQRSAQLRADAGRGLDDPEALRRHLEKNPIAAWTGGKAAGGEVFFSYDGDIFRTTFDVRPPEREAFRELARELADWRLGEYLDRPRPAATE